MTDPASSFRYLYFTFKVPGQHGYSLPSGWELVAGESFYGLYCCQIWRKPSTEITRADLDSWIYSFGRRPEIWSEPKAKFIVDRQGRKSWQLADGNLGCYDCHEVHGSPRFPDLEVDYGFDQDREAERHLLCPNCLCARLTANGFKDLPSRFTSGPLARSKASEPEDPTVVAKMKVSDNVVIDKAMSDDHTMYVTSVQDIPPEIGSPDADGCIRMQDRLSQHIFLVYGQVAVPRRLLRDCQFYGWKEVKATNNNKETAVVERYNHMRRAIELRRPIKCLAAM